MNTVQLSKGNTATGEGEGEGEGIERVSSHG